MGAGMGAGLVLVGRFGAAHGVRGEVRLKSFTQDPAAIGAYSPLTDSVGRRSFRFESIRPLKDDMFVVRVASIATREAAEALKGTEPSGTRAALPQPDADEFYHADLVGLRAEDVEDRVIGTVKAIHNYGAGDVIEIEIPGGDTVLLAFTRETVPHIEIDKGRIVVAVPRDDEAEREHGVE